MLLIQQESISLVSLIFFFSRLFFFCHPSSPRLCTTRSSSVEWGRLQCHRTRRFHRWCEAWDVLVLMENKKKKANYDSLLCAKVEKCGVQEKMQLMWWRVCHASGETLQKKCLFLDFELFCFMNSFSPDTSKENLQHVLLIDLYLCLYTFMQSSTYVI